jgi:hypothetical protein
MQNGRIRPIQAQIIVGTGNVKGCYQLMKIVDQRASITPPKRNRP